MTWLEANSTPIPDLLWALAQRGVTVTADAGWLVVRPRGALTAEERAALVSHKSAALTFLAALDEAVTQRRWAFAQQLDHREPGAPIPALIYRPGTAYVPGQCYSCGDRLPHPHPGRCYACSLAARYVFRADIPPDLLEAYDSARLTS